MKRIVPKTIYSWWFWCRHLLSTTNACVYCVDYSQYDGRGIWLSLCHVRWGEPSWPQRTAGTNSELLSWFSLTVNQSRRRCIVQEIVHFLALACLKKIVEPVGGFW